MAQMLLRNAFPPLIYHHLASLFPFPPHAGTASTPVADRVNPQRMYATEGGSLYHSADGGRTFSQGARGVLNVENAVSPGKKWPCLLAPCVCVRGIPGPRMYVRI